MGVSLHPESCLTGVVGDFRLVACAESLGCRVREGPE